ncbi:MAG: hypothetical protein KC496_21265, partial [Anaerolineae bacterium]|nr:hypothetical protein [Anaerolineae bacterium]
HWNDRLSAYNKTAVVLGIPATAFLLGDTEASANAGGYVQGEVENEEGLIGEIIVMFKIEEGTSLAAIFQSMDDLVFPIGSSIRLGIDSEQLCLFDFDTEATL